MTIQFKTSFGKTNSVVIKFSSNIHWSSLKIWLRTCHDNEAVVAFLVKGCASETFLLPMATKKFLRFFLSLTDRQIQIWSHQSVVGTRGASWAALQTLLFSTDSYKRILWNTWAWVIPPPHTGPKILRVRLLAHSASCVTQVNRRTKFWERGAYVSMYVFAVQWLQLQLRSLSLGRFRSWLPSLTLSPPCSVHGGIWAMHSRLHALCQTS